MKRTNGGKKMRMQKKANTTLYIAAVLVVLVVVGFVGYTQGWFDELIGSDEPECGDGDCEGDETFATCAEDCTINTCDYSSCGDGICNQGCGETAGNCATDCQTITCNGCGDGTCEPLCGESQMNCVDCDTSGGAAVPIEQLNGACKNSVTMAAVTTGNLSFYAPGADVSDPYTLPLDKLDCGGNTTEMILQTLTNYDVYYNSEGATNYDEKVNVWDFSYNPSTGKGILLVGGQSYYPVKPVGSFVSMDTLPEIESGMYDNGTNKLSYNETVLGGSGWFKADIGNADANTELRDVVMCFRDNDGDLEGDEITGFTASYDSGSTAITIPASLQQYWEDAAGGGGASCVSIASVIGSAEKARWTFTMTVNEANFIENSEDFQIDFDDGGDYLEKQYPSRSAKATVTTLNIYTTT